MTNPLHPGLYERIITNDLARRLATLDPALEAKLRALSSSESASRIARYLRQVIEGALLEFEDSKDGLAAQITLANRMLLGLQRELAERGKPNLVDDDDLIRAELLLALLRNDPISGAVPLPRPGLPLAETHLLINARGEHQVGHELALEIGSADRVDLLCAFLLWSGYTRLKNELKEFLSRPGAKMRVLTTVYMGATEPRVLEELHQLGAEIRISYDTHRTRLHAKAWLLHRDSGHSTAFVGSSNLSAAALTDGLEWNVRAGEDAPLVLEKFNSAFETYWCDPAFESYDPNRDAERLKSALNAQRSKDASPNFTFDLTPRPFQEAILEKLEMERFVHGRMRNLVVAATGTGKTVIAAFDFKRLSERFRAEHNRLPRLLFVAHRKELLHQARETFRAVLRNTTFGELMVDGERPSGSDVLFASVQSLARIEPSSVPADRWDIVIVDEFHHAEADSYSRWLKHLAPWVLVGLTATPERADGQDVTEWVDGHIAVELRLWDAIEQGFLSPFQYFGLKDPIDLTQYWKRGQLDLAGLDNVLTGHHARAEAVLRGLFENVADPKQMRAIGFCVGQGHARFMAEYFTKHGLLAKTALGSDDDRAQTLAELQAGTLRAVFTVDALSEGVDVPAMDTALFLRPTTSPTVFLQQLGRGLRLSEGKRCLTVLDFVATPSREFRLDRKYLALLGGTRKELEAQIEMGFPTLPAGCSIQLTDDAKEVVLANVRASLSARSSTLLEALRRLGSTATIAGVVRETGLSAKEIYRKRSLAALRREAGFSVPAAGPDEDQLAKGLARLVTLDSPTLLREIAHDCKQDAAPAPTIGWKIVLATLFGDQALSAPHAALSRLWGHPALVRELAELADYLSTQGEYLPAPFAEGRFGLEVHCNYRREQIIAGLTGSTRDKLTTSREGVMFVREHSFDVFFVTLTKSHDRYSPTTRYKDYPLSRDLFHWQSMSSTRRDSERGRRHLDHKKLGITPLLFVRNEPEDELGETQPFMFLGPLSLRAAEGERPISITWQLEVPMPALFFEHTRVIA